MTGKINLSYVNYFGGINYGQIASAFQIDSIGLFTASAKYIHYGDITKSQNGEIDGIFSAQDLSISIGYIYPIFINFNLGVNFKFISSYLYTYSSYGIATDIGISYHNQVYNFVTTLLIRNIGFQIKPYHHNRESLPFEVLLGFSKTLENAPICFTLTIDHLQTFNTLYEKENKKTFGQKLLSHLIIGTEIFPKRMISLRLGYNFRKSQEMQVSYKKAFNGLSFGLQIKLSQFRLSYGQSIYHLRGGTHQFTLRVDLENIF